MLKFYRHGLNIDCARWCGCCGLPGGRVDINWQEVSAVFMKDAPCSAGLFPFSREI